jgi:hypothetical protein
MSAGWHTQEPASSDGIPLQKGSKALLKAYYANAHLPSPMGGFLEPLTVRQESNGSGTILLECSTSSLRFELSVPKANKQEKARVKAAQEAGEIPLCPRHEDPAQRLQRIGGRLVCPRCGVRFGRPI